MMLSGSKLKKCSKALIVPAVFLTLDFTVQIFSLICQLDMEWQQRRVTPFSLSRPALQCNLRLR
jgi:hypothetical protein